MFFFIILKIKYKKTLNKRLDFKNLQRLSEKIQWIKLHGITDKKILLSDKIIVKEYISKCLPDLQFAKIYQSVNCFKELNFQKLPEKFILKTNHAWKTNIIINNKTSLTNEDYIIIENFYKKVLKINYAYWSYYELQYKDIKPQIFAEELLDNDDNIKDYEVWCFNGKPEFVSYRYLKILNDYKKYEQYFFNSKWEPVDFYICYKGEENPELSINKDKIINYAKILSEGIDFVRVDFMEINNELYFGEMTFTPYSGFLNFTPDYYDEIYGRKLILNKK